jgi:hypothetical protein
MLASKFTQENKGLGYPSVQDSKGEYPANDILGTLNARSKIHISCDLWTSSNLLAILGVVAHFVTEDGKLQRCVLALKDIIGKHTGENLAQAMVEVLEEWRFASKLGYFVMDNAENNDTMMDSPKRELARHWHIKYDPKTHRLRCQGHIINLAVQSFLFVTNSENIEEEGITLDDMSPSLALLSGDPH